MSLLSPELLQVLKHDGVAVIPTDTLYGIVASAFSKKAVLRIYDVKGRDDHKPCIILIASIADLKKFGVVLDTNERRFLKTVWPGPVSVIAKCPLKKFEYLHRGGKSLAFRLPNNASLQQLLKKTGPLVAPSTNPQGKAPAQTIQEAQVYFGTAIDLYVSGPKKRGKPSTVVSLVSKKPEILRQGATKIKLDGIWSK